MVTALPTPYSLIAFSYAFVRVIAKGALRKTLVESETTLQEGNVFTGIYPSRGIGTSHALRYRSQGTPPPRHQTWAPTPQPPFPRHRTWAPPHSPGHLPPCCWHLVVTIGDLFKLGHLRTTPPPTPSPPVLTSNDGYRKTYGWQAGGAHPTGMLSCSCMISL